MRRKIANLSPQSALVAVDAVHDSGDIVEMWPELLSQSSGLGIHALKQEGITSPEQKAYRKHVFFVEVIGELLDRFE